MTQTKNRKCGGKIRHATSEAASVHRARLITEGASGEWLNTYRCDHCGGFHVGHRPGRRKR